jgi:hypothetical protein
MAQDAPSPLLFNNVREDVDMQASDFGHELSIEHCKRAADAARFGFDYFRILLCGTAGVVVF